MPDAYGDVWWNMIGQAVDAAGIKFVAQERYQRNDTSVTGQILKIMTTNPDAVLIGGWGTPAVLPQASLVERGYKGRIYQTHGVANRDFLRVAEACEARSSRPARMWFGPSNSRLPSVEKGGTGICERVREDVRTQQPLDLRRPRVGRGAAADARSGGAEEGPAGHARVQAGAARCARGRQGSRGHAQHVQHRRPRTDHLGLDSRARVLVRIENGDWKILK